MNFQSKFTKLIFALIFLLAGIMAYAASTGNLTTLPQQIMGAVAVPIQRMTATVTGKISTWQNNYLNTDKIIDENEELKKELTRLRMKQVEYDKLLMENEQYKEFLSIKETNPHFEVESASVIGRDGLDKFYSFTIDKGEKDGINKNDVVMSAEGVIGVVLETGPNYARVSTILSPAVNVGCFVSATRDNGVVSGDSNFSEELKCVMRYLPKNTQAKEGDLVTTTGIGEVFPKDLIVGTIENIEIDPSGNSKYATVKPVADIAHVKFVFVITNY